MGESPDWSPPLEVDDRGIVIDPRDNAPFEVVDARTARGKLLRPYRVKRACALRSYGLLTDEIGWVIGVSPATAAAYCWGTRAVPELAGSFAVVLEVFTAGRATWAWHLDGHPRFGPWPNDG